MADNYTFKDASNTTVTAGADDFAGVLVPRAKIVLGADGENIGDHGGVLVDSTKAAAFVRERSDIRIAQPTVTVSTTPAYTAGDCVGGLITIASTVTTAGNAIRPSGIVISSAVNPTGFDVYLLRDTPAGTYTDNGALTIASGDRAAVVAMATGTAASKGGFYWAQFGPTNTVFMPDFTLVGTSLYLLVATTGTPTFGATTDVKVNVLYQRL